MHTAGARDRRDETRVKGVGGFWSLWSYDKDNNGVSRDREQECGQERELRRMRGGSKARRRESEGERDSQSSPFVAHPVAGNSHEREFSVPQLIAFFIIFLY